MKKHRLITVPTLRVKGILTLFILAIGSVAAYAQVSSRTVTGRVTGGNEPQIGVTVIVKGTQKGTVTDSDGRFSIQGVSPEDVLVFSSVGMTPQEIAVADRITIDVEMEDDTKFLDEVVVVGYGTRRRADLTGSMAVIGEDNIRKTQAANIGMALQGMGAGVEISRSGSSTHPAHTPEIRVRGARSLSAGNDPLWVVDGIPYDVSLMNNISQDDIASVTVLKDASSTAIYGARGANGVILITTTRGFKGSAPKVSYSGYAGFSKALGEYDMMDAAEYMEMRKWAIWNRFPGEYENFDDPALIDKVFEMGMPAEIEGYENGTDVNWQREIFQKTPVLTNHSVNITGGTQTT
jgi:TonB-dependent SusC/RagA subfamily outer membrane receptor